jgi:hypothetical protein
LGDVLGDAACRQWTGEVCRDNGKFIATEPRHHLVPIENCRDAFRNLLQERITGSMPEQVVHFLEAIKVEAEHGK